MTIPLVLLLGGASGVGKSTVAREIGRRLGRTWVMVDDLRLALERSGLPIPRADLVDAFDAPGGLVEVGELVAPAVEVVVENHVDGRVPAVIEGDGILPSLLERPSLGARAAHVRAVFVHEDDEDALLAAMQARRRGVFDRAHARKNLLFGRWLAAEAERRGIPVVPARPWETLADRILTAAGEPSALDGAPRPPDVRRAAPSGPRVEVRRITPSEADDLLAIARRYWQELMPRWRGNRDPAYQAAYFADRFRLDDADSAHWWAVLDGEHVGFAKVDLRHDQDGRWADWRDLFVEPAHRRHGVGTAFADAVIAWLRDHSYDRIDLNVRQDNPRALAFWRSVGFDLALYRLRMYLGD